MRPKDENKELDIRRQAVEMIVKTGFDGLSMQKLAKKVGISPSTIYVYFESREDLLNKLYLEIQNRFEKDALDNFSADLSFEEGLWLQWKNRLRNMIKAPMDYQFYEQFRTSPLINHQAIKPVIFRKVMNDFVANAVKKKEIKDLPLEVFWAMAYGPFYTLVKFHLDQANIAGKPFSLTEQKLKQAFDLVISALKR
ncbi:transcriptional regulator, TetR family [Chitinophaga terrae (ex Kim and Jung 2007)]|uniref:Transcriptional regulator, TetR family n=1 Tax=Chitinophaga terrae (ex Kim and Jung 2007) TaxID=408074 RepID=A0A1H4BRV7_9BACT|nr:TetR/AcrR family transcriptional regulator [Chitinophaga terrae (ex Kim and Jung 2007)]MDQ0108694.1 AcrR family transcriptional regulator [Chitinophaga terrae (ex Kim and Jung 2007)]GEP89741.1 TetR family transcriptional regulator [Chitinophaga terrae (ex Kim and Jung 2007)]SEA50906.1 transcriptional regulator, TetR family [Chitinophaga terrae (ex Kim and Jung 2007)]